MKFDYVLELDNSSVSILNFPNMIVILWLYTRMSFFFGDTPKNLGVEGRDACN